MNEWQVPSSYDEDDDVRPTYHNGKTYGRIAGAPTDSDECDPVDPRMNPGSSATLRVSEETITNKKKMKKKMTKNQKKILFSDIKMICVASNFTRRWVAWLPMDSGGNTPALPYFIIVHRYYELK